MHSHRAVVSASPRSEGHPRTLIGNLCSRRVDNRTEEPEAVDEVRVKLCMYLLPGSKQDR